jgi:catechol 2,3-dioxygenase-like lactoylglutathione lyase family enzyme
MISGLYENIIATRDMAAALNHWAQFGYRPVQEGTLEAAQAKALYGHESPLRAVRLQNGAVDTHGLLRLWEWGSLRDAGLGQADPLTAGGRWFIHNCADIFLLKDTYDDMAAAGDRYRVSNPDRAQFQPFDHPRVTIDTRKNYVRELMVLGDEIRQAFFQRYNYNRPGYGTINLQAPLRTSEHTHSSYIVADDSERSISFYVEALGMRNSNAHHHSHGAKPGNAETLMMRPEQEFMQWGYMAPGTICGMFQFYKPLWEGPNLQEQSRPGSRGLCLSTFRVDDVGGYRAKVVANEATRVSAVWPNEFGEQACTFVAPDGTSFGLVS